MRNSLLIDSGFWLALINSNDHYHRRAVGFLTQCRSPLVTTWPVVTETCHLVLNRVGASAQTQFIASLAKGRCMIWDLRVEHLKRLPALMEKYADLPMDLADASLVLLAEEAGHGRILSTDRRDFQAYRWKNHHPFQNMLLPE